MAATAITSLVVQVRRYLLEITQLTTPVAPVITNGGTPGAITYTYKVVALNSYGHSIASSAGSTTTGNATLTTTNYNRVTITSLNGATGYQIYRTVSGGTPSSTGLIGTIGEGDTYLDDTGLAGDSATAPTTNTSGVPQPFWSDAELVDIMEKGAKDLWGAILDLHAEHYLTVDTTNVTLAASANSLTGVPTDCFRVYLIEPADTTDSSTSRGVIFTPKDYNDPDFISARTSTAVDPSFPREIYYCVSSLGPPSGAPTVLTAPQLTTAMSLRFVYNQTISLTSSGTNPVSGESDQALIAYTVAFARAKEREDRAPDAGWLAIYATEKQALQTRMTPRQDQEPDVVPDMFGGWSN